MQQSAATAKIAPLGGGGIEVKMVVPTYMGEAVLVMRAERDIDGDWRVVIPSGTHEEGGLPDAAYVPDAEDPTKHAYEFVNGIAYLGSPEEDEDG